MSSYYGQNVLCPTYPCNCRMVMIDGALTKVCDSCCLGPYTPGCNSCNSNSVLLGKGLFSFKQSLLSISGVSGFSWGFGLDYLAGNGVNGIVGKNFNFPQNMQLQSVSGGNIQLASGENTLELFIQTSPGIYVAAPENNTRANLTRSGSGLSDQFTLISSAGTVTKFFGFDAGIATPGCIQSVTDRYGTTQSYHWQNFGGLNQLTSVTDSYGRMIDYSYYGSESGYRLQQIADFLGRQLDFQFDQFGHLVAVITPSILQAAPGNTFPGGTAYVFQYDVNNPRPERRDDLVKIWYPNEATPFIDTAARTINVQQVYQSATPRYVIEYGQDPTDEELYGLVLRETVGDPANGIGGTYQYLYTTQGLPSNLIDPSDPIMFRCIVTDRNDNQTIYDFNGAQVPVHVELIRSRMKISIPPFSGTGGFGSYETWTKYNVHNQPLVVVYPMGNSIEYTYEDGNIPAEGSNPGFFANQRVGLLLSRKQRYDNGYSFTVSLPASPGTSATSPEEPTDQTQLIESYFYDPIFNAQCAMIERRGNPINGDAYFTPQNGGAVPTDSNRSRYATLNFQDYQKNQASSVESDTNLQSRLGLTSAQITSLIAFVGAQMTSGGLPSGFPINLGDINGDGTGDGASSGLPYAKPLGNLVKIQHPEVTLVQSGDPSTWTPNQVRGELFTTNAHGQTTTHTDPEGNLSVYVRYPFNDPEGNGGLTDPNLGTNGGKQYGRPKEIHVDADPNDVLSLVGTDGDLVDFIPGKISRSNTSNVYQDLVTRFEGGSGASGSGCASCAYDALGNPLAQTDPRGFTMRFDRNELGETYRTISPQPYNFAVETYYDANRNTIRVDIEDQQPAYDSADPSSACYAHFSPSGSGGTSHVPMQPGPGGSVRPGWFTNLYQFDLLDNKNQDDIDATGSTPANLITTYQHDPNQNLIFLTKPQGNIVEYDYDERNLRIATRVGMVPGGESGSITITPYDANGNVLMTIGPTSRGGTTETAMIADAFRFGTALTHTGDLTANTFDGFDRLLTSTDPLGNVESKFYDPNGKDILNQTAGADGYGHSGVLLASGESRYDEGGRQYESQRQVFVPSTVILPSGRTVTHNFGSLSSNSLSARSGWYVVVSSGTGTGPSYTSYVLARTIYDRAGRTTSEFADNSAQATVAFDGANRPIVATDALGNTIQNIFDANGNVILSTRNEVCTITAPTVANEVFQSAMLYDSLNRFVVRTQQGADATLDLNLLSCGSTAIWQVPSDTIINRCGYDSRGNQPLMIDPKGNTTVTVFDGASRAIQTQQHLRIAGQGSSPPVFNQSNAALTLNSQLPASTGSLLAGASACIVTTMILDGNGRLTQLIDDRGDVTSFQFDTMDRHTVTTFHDGSTRTNVYDEAGDVSIYTDENGSVFSNAFDALGRKTAVSIALASGVSGTTGQSFQFDGLSQMTFAQDTVGSTDANVTLVYDSISRVLEESESY